MKNQNQSQSIEQLIEILNQAKKKSNDAAAEIISNAILEFAEKQSLEEGIKIKSALAIKLINGGSM